MINEIKKILEGFTFTENDIVNKSDFEALKLIKANRIYCSPKAGKKQNGEQRDLNEVFEKVNIGTPAEYILTEKIQCNFHLNIYLDLILHNGKVLEVKVKTSLENIEIQIDQDLVISEKQTYKSDYYVCFYLDKSTGIYSFYTIFDIEERKRKQLEEIYNL